MGRRCHQTISGVKVGVGRVSYSRGGSDGVSDIGKEAGDVMGVGFSGCCVGLSGRGYVGGGAVACGIVVGRMMAHREWQILMKLASPKM